MLVRSSLSLFALLALLAAAPGCDGASTSGATGGEGSTTGNGDLTTGMYEVSDVDVTEDTCASGMADLEGESLPVVVEGKDIEIGEYFTGEIEDGVFETGASEEVDLNEDGFDCVLAQTYIVNGFTTDDDAADVSYNFKLTVVDGEECEDAMAEFGFEGDLPCTTEAAFHIERVGDLEDGEDTDVPDEDEDTDVPEDDNEYLDAGWYVFDPAEISPNTCGFEDPFYAYYAGAEVYPSSTEVIVALDDMDLYYTVDGLDLYDESSPGADMWDLSDAAVAEDLGLSRPYDCEVTGSTEYVGSIDPTKPNEILLQDIYDFSGTGTECSAVSQSLGLAAIPCSSVDWARAILEN